MIGCQYNDSGWCYNHTAHNQRYMKCEDWPECEIKLKLLKVPARDRLNELYIQRQREFERFKVHPEIESCQVLALVDLLEERGLL